MYIYIYTCSKSMKYWVKIPLHVMWFKTPSYFGAQTMQLLGPNMSNSSKFKDHMCAELNITKASMVAVPWRLFSLWWDMTLLIKSWLKQDAFTLKSTCWHYLFGCKSKAESLLFAEHHKVYLPRMFQWVTHQ